MPRPALLAVSHGTSDAAGAAAIALLVRRVAERLPDVDVHEGFVDVQQPDAPSTLAAIDGPAVIVPLLLSQGFHVRVDLGRAARPRADAVVTDPLGPDRRLAGILARRLDEAGAEPVGPVVLAVAGSRDPRSLPDAEGMAALLAVRLGREVVPAYLAAREPSVPDVLLSHPGAPVATYLLAHGYFYDVTRRVADSAPVTEPLLDDGEPPVELVDLVVDRYRAGEAELARAEA
ncbi:sirohydrochlorin chelatase [Microbacterium sp. ASV81]|uniref:CbiX/SirB N-terminal domain-containing protein n=1 Tax=Microbacterium capsulatum TaxID=3041921 RepID=A0ABU0XEH8_9MICO|nr:CbiX/SirB N-terminal domain-containing protein [Microbacterium sp. ASV81]MDQ4213519.1 CbiX/SirB N-terminal domain-containing protein [Microbacterium sp. ASV81]